jgi:hypothetical protein
MVRLGTPIYPLPLLVMVNPVIVFPEIFTVAVACIPPVTRFPEN